MAKFKSNEKFDIPNGIYRAIWVNDKITFYGYGKTYEFFIQGYISGCDKTEKREGFVELINGLVYVDDNKDWITE